MWYYNEIVQLMPSSFFYGTKLSSLEVEYEMAALVCNAHKSLKETNQYTHDKVSMYSMLISMVIEVYFKHFFCHKTSLFNILYHDYFYNW